MEVQVAQLSPVLVEYSFTVEKELVQKEVEKAFLDLQKRACVRGFRPGKAPREVLQHLYGASVTRDVCSRLVDETLDRTLTERKVQPLSQPAVEMQPVKTSEPLQFKARFEVRPEIKDLVWEGLEAEKPRVVVTDEDIAQEIEKLRKAHSTLVSPEAARPAQARDMVTISFKVLVDGKQVDEGKELVVEVGEGRLMAELDAGILGMSTGENKKIEVNFPEGHVNPALRGKLAHFDLNVLEIKERKLPELDDEFAKDVGEFENLDALRANVRTRLEKERGDAAEQQLVANLVTALCNKNKVETPSALVQQQFQMTYQDMRQSARRMGRDLPLTQDLQQQLTVDSQIKVQAGLLMAEIAQRNSLTIVEADLEKAMAEIAQESGKNLARVKAEYRDAGRRQMLMGMVLEDKVLDLIISKATIKEIDPPAKQG